MVLVLVGAEINGAGNDPETVRDIVEIHVLAKGIQDDVLTVILDRPKGTDTLIVGGMDDDHVSFPSLSV